MIEKTIQDLTKAVVALTESVNALHKMAETLPSTNPAPEPTSPAAQAPAPAPAPNVVPITPEVPTTIDKAMVQAKLASVAKKLGDPTKVMALLTPYKVTKLSDLPPANYQAVMTAAEQLEASNA